MSISADLSRAGHRVTLFEAARFKKNLDPIRKQGGVFLIEGDAQGEVVPLAGVTADPGRAVKGAEVVIIVVPCFGHEWFAKTFVPRLNRDQVVVFMGEGGGALVFHSVRKKLGKGKGIVVGETNTLPYSARITGPGAANIRVKKKGGVIAAALPALENTSLLSAVHALYPNIRPATNVLETVLVNFNAIDHVATVLANAGHLESRTTNMLLWGEGATPSVAR